MAIVPLDAFPLEPWAIVTSPFGPRWGRNHNGTDYGSPNPWERTIDKTPQRAPFRGRLERFYQANGAGQWVAITAGNKQFRSFHLSSYDPGAPHGSIVEAGQVYGYTGTTGASTGPHAHLELLINGSYIDPQPSLEAARAKPTPPPTPVPDPDKDWFDMATAAELEAIVRKVVQEEMLNQDARINVRLGAPIDAMLTQLDPAGVAAGTAVRPSEPYLRQLVERVVNKTEA